MSEYFKYNPRQFHLERAEGASSELGQFVLDVSKLNGAETEAWVPVEFSTFGYEGSYSPDDNGTLIIDSESATVSMSYWDNVADPLYPADRIKARYGGRVILLGTVSGTTLTYSVDPDAVNHQATRRVDLSATVVGTYAAALGKQICWNNLPEEKPIKRIRRWVHVNGWVEGGVG